MCVRAACKAKTHVRCSEETHTIILTDNGKLAFPNHPNLRTEVILLCLASEQLHVCGQVLEAWQNQDRSKVPRALWKKLAKAMRQRRQRERLRQLSGGRLH
jgi:hypothetical protein